MPTRRETLENNSTFRDEICGRRASPSKRKSPPLRPDNHLELIGKRIRLRSVDDSDIDQLHEWWNDPAFAGEFANDYPKGRTEVEALAKSAWFFIIESRPGNNKIGFISYYSVRQDYPYLFEIGYRVKPDERRKGYTTEATRLLVDHLFATRKDIERIESVTDVDNVPSQRVLEKNGFRREGVLRKRVFNRGRYGNEYMYSLLRDEWAKARESE
jgi:RimJ/RimL family protein N-acetyltransferase